MKKSKKIEDMTKEDYGVRVRTEKEIKDSLKETKRLEDLLSNITEFPFIKDLFTDENGVSFAKVVSNGHHEYWETESSQMKRFILHYLFEKQERRVVSLPSENAIKQAMRLLSAKAEFEGVKNVKTYLRFAHIGKTIYFDPCRDDWKVYRINKEGIVLIDNSPVVFKRYNHMLPVEVDINAKMEDINLIFKYVKIIDENEKILYKTGLVLNGVPDIPRAIMLLHGDPGSGKSYGMNKEKETIDRSSIGLFSLRDKEDFKDLNIKLEQNYLAYFDNCDKRLAKELSDKFCRVTTGEGIQDRKLFTNNDSCIRRFMRKLAFNGLNLIAGEPDFLDRTIDHEIEKIENNERKTERELDSLWTIDQPKITGAIFKILQKTLTEIDGVNVNKLPRMADYGLWGETVSRVLKEKSFLKLYNEKIGVLSKEVLMGDQVALCVIELMENRDIWEGSPSELLTELQSSALNLNIDTKNKYFPQNPTWTTIRLSKIKVNLRGENIYFFKNTRGTKRKLTLINDTKHINPVTKTTLKKLLVSKLPIAKKRKNVTKSLNINKNNSSIIEKENRDIDNTKNNKISDVATFSLSEGKSLNLKNVTKPKIQPITERLADKENNIPKIKEFIIKEIQENIRMFNKGMSDSLLFNSVTSEFKIDPDIQGKCNYALTSLEKDMIIAKFPDEETGNQLWRLV